MFLLLSKHGNLVPRTTHHAPRTLLTPFGATWFRATFGVFTSEYFQPRFVKERGFCVFSAMKRVLPPETPDRQAEPFQATRFKD
jgi:hypothetical protein